MPIAHRSVTAENFNNRRGRGGLVELRATKKSRAKPGPPDQTNAENFYYLKQMSAKTPMVIVLTDGQEINGWIEWYDRNCLKVNRDAAPNLVIQKHCIKYLFKQEELR